MTATLASLMCEDMAEALAFLLEDKVKADIQPSPLSAIDQVSDFYDRQCGVVRGLQIRDALKGLMNILELTSGFLLICDSTQE